MITHSRSPVFTLAHPDDSRQCEFWPAKDGTTVHVAYRSLSGQWTESDLSTEEAREYWRRLVAKGFERW